MPTSAFRDARDDWRLPAKFVYYVTGAPAVGKTTIVSALRGFGVVNEWLEPSPASAARDFESLTQEEKTALDCWVSRQFRLKNRFLHDEQEGIFVVDRGPLDPLSYQLTRQERANRAHRHIEEISKSNQKLHEGALLLLRGDRRELIRRLVLRDKIWREDSVKFLSESIEEVYSGQKISSVETSDFSVRDIIARLLEIIMRESYAAVDFDSALQKINGSDE
jgi:hypothetical protein